MHYLDKNKYMTLSEEISKLNDLLDEKMSENINLKRENDDLQLKIEDL